MSYNVSGKKEVAKGNMDEGQKHKSHTCLLSECVSDEAENFFGYASILRSKDILTF